jgi:hypothetical protein
MAQADTNGNWVIIIAGHLTLESVRVLHAKKATEAFRVLMPRVTPAACSLDLRHHAQRLSGAKSTSDETHNQPWSEIEIILTPRSWGCRPSSAKLVAGRSLDMHSGLDYDDVVGSLRARDDD